MATAIVYTLAGKHLTNGDIDLNSDTIKGALITNAYSPNRDADETFADVVADEAAGAGYTARGLALSARVYGQSGHATLFDCDDLIWDPITIAFQYLVLFKDSGSDPSSWLIGYIDFGTDITDAGGILTLAINASGAISITATG